MRKLAVASSLLFSAVALGVAGCGGQRLGSLDGSTGGSGGAGGQGGNHCAFADTYTVIDSGGLVPTRDTATFTPPNAFRYERESFVSDAGQPSCSPALPACGDPARIDVADIERDVAHADVQEALALATAPNYGDRGIVDGPAFVFTRADGRGFVAGFACSVPSATCTPIPAGVSTLVADLRALIRDQLADPSCAGFR